MSTSSNMEMRELDHRHNDGIDVTLVWNSETNGVLVVVADERRGNAFTLDVAAADALDAFHHPYAYFAGDEHQHALAA